MLFSVVNENPSRLRYCALQRRQQKLIVMISTGKKEWSPRRDEQPTHNRPRGIPSGSTSAPRM
jgi:hypothetical protein